MRTIRFLKAQVALQEVNVMFVRWRSYPIARRPFVGGRRYQAILLECQRVDGKPRQKFISYLGVYCESRNFVDRIDRVKMLMGFCDRADAVLDSMDLSDEERLRLKVQLVARGPRPRRQLAGRIRKARQIAKSRASA